MTVAAYQTERRTLRHLKVSGASPALSFEPCEDPGCVVEDDDVASSCGRLACPACGCGGTNLSTFQLAQARPGTWLDCTCGHSWIHGSGAFDVDR